MAKSLRSKWKRKMRAVKRERYGKKELEKLKLMLGVDQQTDDVAMKNEEDVIIVDEVKKTIEEVPEVEDKPEEKVEHMDDGRRVYNRKTMRDQFGQYPVWLSSSKIKNLVKKSKTMKRQKKKKADKVSKKSKNKKR